MNYLSLFIFVFVMFITPGPNNILLTVSGTRFGYIKTLRFIAGIGIGLASQLILFSAGLGALFTTFPNLQNILKIPGVIYILYLAYKLAFKSGKKGDDSTMERPFTVSQGFIFQYLNPKALLMTLTTASLYSVEGDGYIRSIVIIVLTFIVTGVSCNTLWTLCGKIIGKLTLGKDSQTVNRVLGIVTAASVYFII